MKAFLISGAGSGIGAATVQHLAKTGEVKFYLVGRNTSKLEASARKLPAHVECELITCDVAQRESCIELIGGHLAQEQNLYAVISNAGIGGENKFGPHDRWDEIIATNLTGSYNLTQVAISALQRSQNSTRHIIFISSILARLGVPHYSAYCAAKAGLLGLTRSMAAQFARDNILVNAIAPGWVDTDMATAGIEAMAKATSKSYDQARKEQMSYVPLGRMSTPGEIANLITYLTGDEQQSITGQTLDINNGAIMP